MVHASVAMQVRSVIILFPMSNMTTLHFAAAACQQQHLVTSSELVHVSGVPQHAALQNMEVSSAAGCGV